MRARMLFAFTAAMLATSVVAQAEPVSPYFYVSPVAGYTLFQEPLKLEGTPSDDLALKDNLYFGGRLGYQMLPWLGIEAAGGYTPTQFDVGLRPQGQVPGDAEGRDRGRDRLPEGLRRRRRARRPRRVRRHAEGRHRGREGLPERRGRRRRPRRDRQVRRPPKGATVDAAGCPQDSDGDGVLDGLDQCPGTPAGMKGGREGLRRGQRRRRRRTTNKDQCPDTPAGLKVELRRLPDRDLGARDRAAGHGSPSALQNVNFETGKADAAARVVPDARRGRRGDAQVAGSCAHRGRRPHATRAARKA